MDEERLLKIMSTISVLSGPFAILGYLATLSEDEIGYIKNSLKNAGYVEGSNFYISLESFAKSYISGKTVAVDNEFLTEFGYKKEYAGQNGPKR